jgi:hypothetical protein
MSSVMLAEVWPSCCWAYLTLQCDEDAGVGVAQHVHADPGQARPLRGGFDASPGHVAPIQHAASRRGEHGVIRGRPRTG